MQTVRHVRMVGRCTRRVFGAGALSVLGSAGALAAALSIEACASDSETGGRRIVLDTRIGLAPNGTTFTTAAGWDVTLTRAVISTGPIYYFDGAPPLVLRGTSKRLERFALRALGLGTAHAHPGHYQAGHALGQMLEPWSVDLLAGMTDLATGDGVTGRYRSARFSFSMPPVGPMAGELNGHAAVAEGVAVRAGEAPRLFRAVADLADIARSAAEGHVDGCEFSELDIEDSGRVTLSVIPKVWFDLVDFGELPAAEARSEFPVDSQPKIAFSQGLAQLSAYKFSYAAE